MRTFSPLVAIPKERSNRVEGARTKPATRRLIGKSDLTDFIDYVLLSPSGRGAKLPSDKRENGAGREMCSMTSRGRKVRASASRTMALAVRNRQLAGRGASCPGMSRRCPS